MQKIVACIPIKLNSERLERKNVKPFYDGTPLMVMLQKTLLNVERISEIYVFCGNDDVKDYVVPGVKFLKRSENLDLATATPQMIISEFMEKVDADVYAFCHVTSPFVSVESLNDCIDHVLMTEYDSAFTAQKLQKLMWRSGAPLNFNASNIPRTQDLTPIYSEVSAAYFFKKEVFLNTGRRVGETPYICELNEIESIDIDTAEDFKIADAVYRVVIGGNC